ncbi:peritrophin-1 [Anopheles nili]|uniref:peritrophin-1 n=1 Tax=Anopheles nili TaxID=185578 RepID=UPI00237B1513|nr:peritrophin-1 [Anopheles nili]
MRNKTLPGILLAIVGCTLAQTTTDPCVEQGLTSGFLPHPTDCTKYISCYGGKGYEQTCPDGKHYDAALQVCDLAENVGCVVNNCPADGIVFLPIEGVCDRYIICIGGTAFESTCDEGLYFDERIGECNLKEDSGCVVNPCTRPPPNPPILEIYPNDSNCKQYLICLDGEPNIKDCAPNLVFDPNELQCPPAPGVTTADPNATSTTADPNAPTTTVDPLDTSPSQDTTTDSITTLLP